MMDVLCAACNQPIKEEDRSCLKYVLGSDEIIEFHDDCKKGVMLVHLNPVTGNYEYNSNRH